MKKILNILSKLGCLFLSIVLFFFICIYLGLYLVPKMVTKENVKVLINEVPTEELIDNKEASLLDDLYKIAEENDIDKDLISEVINYKEFKEVITNYYSEMVEAVLYNETPPRLNAYSIINATEKTLESLGENLGYTITEEDKQIVMDYLNSNAERIIELVPTYDQVIESMGQEGIDALRTLFGNGVKTILIFIIVIILLTMALISWSVYKFAIWSGVATVVAGLIFIFTGAFFYDVVLNSNETVLSISIRNLIENNILKQFSNIGTTTAIIGAVQIAYYFIIRKNSTNIKY